MDTFWMLKFWILKTDWKYTYILKVRSHSDLSWLRTVAPNIHPNVDGEVAYAAPINGLAVGYIQV